MKPRHQLLLLFVSISLLLPACAPRAGDTLRLASFSENGVDVTINLQPLGDGTAIISATFTPQEEGFHLYSKDHPRDGLDGLGRPTLLELAETSQMLASGELVESIPAEVLEGTELMVYPAGPVTLSLTVTLPEGDSPSSEEISLTYMACTTSTCNKPVVGKIVNVSIPGAESIRP